MVTELDMSATSGSGASDPSVEEAKEEAKALGVDEEALTEVQTASASTAKAKTAEQINEAPPEKVAEVRSALVRVLLSNNNVNTDEDVVLTKNDLGFQGQDNIPEKIVVQTKNTAETKKVLSESKVGEGVYAAITPGEKFFFRDDDSSDYEIEKTEDNNGSYVVKKDGEAVPNTGTGYAYWSVGQILQLSQRKLIFGSVLITHTLSETGGGGDPYLYPALSSTPLKLPDKEACYRLYENPISETYINASVTQATPEHQLRMLKFAQSKTLKTHNVICDGYFFDAFHIISEGNSFHINLQNKKVTMNAKSKDYFTMEVKKNSTYSCGAFNGYCNKVHISWTNEETGKNYKMSANFFPNPHVENGIQLLCADYGCAVGCLVRNYRPKLMELPNVTVGKYKKLHRRLKKAKSQFQTKAIKGKNEVWHYGSR